MGLESVKNMVYERGRFINQHAKAWILYKQPWEMGYLTGTINWILQIIYKNNFQILKDL